MKKTIALACGLALTTVAHAKLVSLEITKTQAAFGGQTFGAAGAYEYLSGKMHFEVEPGDPQLATVTNLDKAPVNQNGKVAFSTDVAILKPVDMNRANGKLLYTMPNRGGKSIAGVFNLGGMPNDPITKESAGDGFLMNQGYTLVFSGWQASYPIATPSPLYVAVGSRLNPATSMTADLPIARNKDGSPVIGTSREEFIGGFNANPNNPFIAYLTYPSAHQTATNGTITIRQNERDRRQTPSGLTWRYIDEWRIEITRPPGFDPAAIVEFIYQAKDPTISGLGFVAIRDAVSFLRNNAKDEKGTANPLAFDGRPSIRQAYGFGVSQTGRSLKQLVYEGFNRDENGKSVFDGVMIHVSGASMNSINVPFGQPGRKASQHEDHSNCPRIPIFPADAV